MITFPFFLISPATALPILSATNPKHNTSFFINDCSAVSNESPVINSYSGTASADCSTAKIFSPPEEVPAQVITIVNYHPAELTTNCLVEIDIYTGTCGAITVTNARNHILYNKLVYSGVYSPTQSSASRPSRQGPSPGSPPSAARTQERR